MFDPTIFTTNKIIFEFLVEIKIKNVLINHLYVDSIAVTKALRSDD